MANVKQSRGDKDGWKTFYVLGTHSWLPGSELGNQAGRKHLSPAASKGGLELLVSLEDWWSWYGQQGIWTGTSVRGVCCFFKSSFLDLAHNAHVTDSLEHPTQDARFLTLKVISQVSSREKTLLCERHHKILSCSLWFNISYEYWSAYC